MVWTAGKRVGKRKLRGAAPSVENGRPNRALVAVALAGAAGAAAATTAFVRSRRSSDDEK